MLSNVHEGGWVVSEDRYFPRRAKYFETITTLANGYIGVRGSAEEGSPHEHPGSYVAGVFNRVGDEPPELPNIPSWLGVSIAANGRGLTPRSGRLLAYRRFLDMKRALLVREFRVRRDGKTARIRTERFVSRADVHLAVVRVSFIPEDFSCEAEIAATLDGNVTNSGRRHLDIVRTGSFDFEGFWSDSLDRQGATAGILLEAVTNESAIVIGQASALRLSEVREAGWRPAAPDLTVEQQTTSSASAVRHCMRFQAREGREYVFEKLVTFFTTRDSFADPGEVAIHAVKRAHQAGYESLAAAHQAAWAELWRRSDVQIDGPEADQRSVRFSIFHSLATAPSASDKVSIAAKGLHGEGYRGHVFWDCEIFNLPLFVHTQPETARNLLMYRYHTLPGARRKAQAAGYRGAMYAWESADTGDETTPTWAGHLGERIRIWCGDIEQHISADVAYAVWHYYQATGDLPFLLQHGAEIILETARFWASRFQYNSSQDRYEISCVIGPDEYHEHINNNAFTNAMAQWNIRLALDIVYQLKRGYPSEWAALKSRLRLTERSMREWRRVAERAFIPYDQGRRIHEQFEGFLSLDRVDLGHLNLNGAPVDGVLGRERTAASQVLKQADVVMLMYLLDFEYPSDQIEANFDYYAPICGHGSSLSPSVHAIVAGRLGRSEEALGYLRRSAAVDLDDGMGNSSAGIHMAALGGNWQAVVKGFCGVSADEHALSLAPRLPAAWRSVSFNLIYRDAPVRLAVTHNEVVLDLSEAQGTEAISVNVNGNRRLIQRGVAHRMPLAQETGAAPAAPVGEPETEPALVF